MKQLNGKEKYIKIKGERERERERASLETNNGRAFIEQPIQYPVVSGNPEGPATTFPQALVLLIQPLVDGSQYIEGGA